MSKYEGKSLDRLALCLPDVRDNPGKVKVSVEAWAEIDEGVSIEQKIQTTLEIIDVIEHDRFLPIASEDTGNKKTWLLEKAKLRLEKLRAEVRKGIKMVK